jgi:hypothetical protein
MATRPYEDSKSSDGSAAADVVALACRAPSVHNTQPWQWRVDGTAITLRADRTRQLDVSDPDGRNLTISCGAALHHALVAAAGLGWEATLTRLPDPSDPDLLAVVDLLRPRVPTRAELDLLDALESRQTDRRRFTSWPVPEQHLVRLAERAPRRGARVLPLTGAGARSVVERLIEEAIDVQAADPAYATEQRRWTRGTGSSGIPASALPPQTRPGERRDRFQRQAPGATSDRRVVASDQVIAVCTGPDDVHAWLDAGETLSAIWLYAHEIGLSLVPLSQVIEVATTREALRHEVFFDMAQPQVLARVGWLEISRRPLPSTPRRPLSDVLDVATETKRDS